MPREGNVVRGPPALAIRRLSFDRHAEHGLAYHVAYALHRPGKLVRSRRHGGKHEPSHNKDPDVRKPTTFCARVLMGRSFREGYILREKPIS